MSNLNDYKRHIQVLKMEQKIGRIQKELESADYGDGCPLHGEDDCADVRKAYDRGYVNGLYEALTLFKLIEADTPQTETQTETQNSNLTFEKADDRCKGCGHYKLTCDLFSEICKYEPIDEPQTEREGERWKTERTIEFLIT